MDVETVPPVVIKKCAALSRSNPGCCVAPLFHPESDEVFHVKELFALRSGHLIPPGAVHRLAYLTPRIALRTTGR